MNELYLLVPSNLKEPNYFKRLIESVDKNDHIHIIFLNQHEKHHWNDIVSTHYCDIEEIFLGKVIPLSIVRNIGLDYLRQYIKPNPSTAIVMFVDDDAWFPEETIRYLLDFKIKAISLKTIDPETSKSFKPVLREKGEIHGRHLICDIVSICLVVPYKNIENPQIKFNEKLGLGNRISQGEESLFIYNLCKKGMRIFYDNHLIYHPYKKNFNMNNFYSMSYFWSMGLFKISKIFFVPCIKYLAKYTIAIGFFAKDNRYLAISKNVWCGFLDGKRDRYNILG